MEVDALAPGRLHAARFEQRQGGGKGANVARVLHALGVPAHALLVVAGDAGELVRRDLAASGVPVHAVACPGESRTCLEIVEPLRGRVTQVHGPGPAASAETAGAVLARLDAVARGARWVAVCGSLPPGLPADTPARIVAWGRRRGVRIAVDTRGPALAQAWARGPDLLHVNADEAAAHLGTPPGAIPAAPAGDAARATRGAITSGAGTFPAWEGTRTWRATPPAVRVRNAVGCGDALLAGLLAQLLAGDAFASALRFATALGSADATSPVAGRPDLALARELVARVAIEEERRG